MPYEKQSFENGRVLDAAQLNHMEEGIAAAMQAAEQGGYALEEIVDAVLAALPNGDEVRY